jgi:hypothetical protein
VRRESDDLFVYTPLMHLCDQRQPACYLWIADGRLLYVGETGQGVHTRLLKHEYDLALAHPKNKWLINRIKKIDELQVRYIYVFYTCYPVFYNSIVRPEFTLCDLAMKRRRLLEESAVVNYFQPCLNAS